MPSSNMKPIELATDAAPAGACSAAAEHDGTRVYDCFAVLRDTLPVGGRCLLVGGVASQAECPQSRSLFPRRPKFGLVLGHCLLALMQLLFLLEQSFGAPMRLIRIHAQSRNSLQ
jgi:hypothetical protein